MLDKIWMNRSLMPISLLESIVVPTAEKINIGLALLVKDIKWYASFLEILLFWYKLSIAEEALGKPHKNPKTIALAQFLFNLKILVKNENASEIYSSIELFMINEVKSINRKSEGNTFSIYSSVVAIIEFVVFTENTKRKVRIDIKSM